MTPIFYNNFKNAIQGFENIGDTRCFVIKVNWSHID
jgi:hypothetical protein